MEHKTRLQIEHEKSYSEERASRWKLKAENDTRAISKFSSVISKSLFQKEKPSRILRLDKLWFNSHSPEKEFWVKGCPDYLVDFSPHGYMAVELKLKNQEFRMTTFGGTTRNGTIIKKYGCPSFYLDKSPVYENMVLFCQKTKLPQKAFNIIFLGTTDNQNSIRTMSLSELTQLIKSGWNGQSLQEYGEGYGQQTYLIPKDATKDLGELSFERILSLTVSKPFIPEGVSNENISGQWVTHIGFNDKSILEK